jgi:hypothetical protein
MSRQTINSDTIFRIEWHCNQWYIVDPDNVSVKVPIDSALVDVVNLRHGCVEGYIVSVHGLDLEWASRMDLPTLRAIGVGAQLKRAPVGNCRRGQLDDNGRITWIRQ